MKAKRRLVITKGLNLTSCRHTMCPCRTGEHVLASGTVYFSDCGQHNWGRSQIASTWVIWEDWGKKMVRVRNPFLGRLVVKSGEGFPWTFTFEWWAYRRGRRGILIPKETRTQNWCCGREICLGRRRPSFMERISEGRRADAAGIRAMREHLHEREGRGLCWAGLWDSAGGGRGGK